MKKYYIYVYRDPKTNIPFYVGKGSGKRSHNHLSWKNTSKRLRDKLSSIGNTPIIHTPHVGLEEEEAYMMEETLIRLYGRRGMDPNGCLMNICISSRPPCFKNKNLIEEYYNIRENHPITNNLIWEVECYLRDCDSKKRFNNMLRTELGKRFILATQQYPIYYTVPQRLYHIKHDIKAEPTCDHCKGAVSFKCYDRDTYEYATFCSVTCRNRSVFGKQISIRPRTQQHKQRISNSLKILYASGERTSYFKYNNPMKTITGISKWKRSRHENSHN